MATRRWLGGAPAVAQVVTLTVGGTIEVGDKFKVTINGVTISVSATSTSTTTTATEVTTALNASVIGEFAEITWSSSSAVVTGTADTKGRPFTVTVATTESDDSAADAQTFVLATTVANSGPNDWSTAANWSGTAVPVNSDDVVIDVAISILYGLAQSAVTLTSLTITDSFGEAYIGLPEHEGDYAEYRGTYLAISATTITVRCASQRIKINTGSVQTTLNVLGTGEGDDLQEGLEALLWKGTHASNALNLTRGSVGIAVFGGETATVLTLRLGDPGDDAADADPDTDFLQVRCEPGVTLTTIDQQGGELEIASNAVTLTQHGGDATIRGTATLTTGHIRGGTLWYRSSGTITTLNVRKPGVADFTRDLRARTVTTAKRYGGGVLNDPFNTVTWTNAVTDLP